MSSTTVEARWVFDRSPVVAEKLPGLLEALVVKATQDLEAEAKVNASGRPGPRVVTGILRGSITSETTRAGQRTEGRVFTNVDYAPYLEYGTRYHRAYPFLGPAVDVMRGRIKGLVKALGGEVERTARGGG